jgi:hypothetical protein
LKADENPEGAGAVCDTQAEVFAVKTAAATGTAGGDAQDEVSTVEMGCGCAAVIRHEAKIRQQPEV